MGQNYDEESLKEAELTLNQSPLYYLWDTQVRFEMAIELAERIFQTTHGVETVAIKN
jgi:hypothetical protein